MPPPTSTRLRLRSGRLWAVGVLTMRTMFSTAFRRRAGCEHARGSCALLRTAWEGIGPGEVASREAVAQVVRHYYGEMSRDVASSMSRALRAANAAIGERAEEDRSRTAGMGTTLVGAAIRGRQVLVANVGDSRAYHVRKRGGSRRLLRTTPGWRSRYGRGFLRRIKPSAPAAQSSHEGTRHSPRISRSILYEGVLGAGDCLVLCTDGLSNQVSDEEIELAVRYALAR